MKQWYHTKDNFHSNSTWKASQWNGLSKYLHWVTLLLVTFTEYKYRVKGLKFTVDVGLCSRVLLELMTGLNGRQLCTDNYYTSPEMYLELYKGGINCCGTVHTNRQSFPKELMNLKQDKPDRGYYNYLNNGPLLAADWFDWQYVYFFSKMHIGNHVVTQWRDEIPMAHKQTFLVFLFYQITSNIWERWTRETNWLAITTLDGGLRNGGKKYFHMLSNVHCWMLTCSSNMLN